MNAPSLRLLFATVVASGLVASAGVTDAHAQYFDDTDAGIVEEPESPEMWALEFRLGPYQPNTGAAFDTFFSEDNGPLMAIEFDFLFLELHDWFDVGIGSGFGWVGYDGKAVDMAGNQTAESTGLDLFPIPVLAVLRIDALARQLNIPLLITGKIGADFILWTSGTGGVTQATSMTIGLHWAAQFALELDIFNRRAARALDEEWGINHTFILFELFGSTADTTLPAGPKDGVAWTLGLGMIF